jgi:serine/alanine racemase
MQSDGKSYLGLDYFKVVAAFLVIAIHTSPLSSVNDTANFVFIHILARVAVPFFFMVTGFFILSKKRLLLSRTKLQLFIIKTCKIYGIATLLYLPKNVSLGYFKDSNLGIKIIKDIFFDGTFYHLWYLPATVLGVVIIASIACRFEEKTVFIIAGILYIVGMFGDKYYGIAVQLPYLKSSYDFMFGFFEFTRNGIFFAPIFLAMGAMAAREEQEYKIKTLVIGFIVSVGMLLGEGLLLHSFKVSEHGGNMYITLIPCMYFLIRLLLRWRGKAKKELRTISMWVYLIHVFMISMIRDIAKALGLESIFIDNGIIHYITVCTVSFASAIALTKLFVRVREMKYETEKYFG